MINTSDDLQTTCRHLIDDFIIGRLLQLASLISAGSLWTNSKMAAKDGVGVGEKREMLINLSLTVADCSLTGDRRATDILAEGRKVDCGTCCNDARANRNDRNLSSHSNWTSFGMIHRIDNQLGWQIELEFKNNFYKIWKPLLKKLK